MKKLFKVCYEAENELEEWYGMYAPVKANSAHHAKKAVIKAAKMITGATSVRITSVALMESMEDLVKQ